MQNGPKTVMSSANPNQRGHLLPAQSGGHRVPPAPRCTGLKVPNEATSDILR
jgi:hypothetical protein